MYDRKAKDDQKFKAIYNSFDSEDNVIPTMHVLCYA